MLGWLSEASTCASRVKRAMRSGSAAKSSGRTLIATSRPSLRVGGAIDLAHAAFTELGGDAIVRDRFGNHVTGRDTSNAGWSRSRRA